MLFQYILPVSIQMYNYIYYVLTCILYTYINILYYWLLIHYYDQLTVLLFCWPLCWFIMSTSCIAFSSQTYVCCLPLMWFQFLFFCLMAVTWPYWLMRITWICYLFNTVRSIQLGHSYFASPDYLAVRAWISAVIQHPNHIRLTGPIRCRFLILLT